MNLIKNNKGSLKVIGIIGFILTTIIMSSYPKTYTRYYEKDKVAIKYKTDLVELYKENASGVFRMTNEINFMISFPRNNFGINEKTKDRYEVLMPEGCKSIINNVETNAVEYYLNDETSYVTVNIVCDKTNHEYGEKIDIAIHEKVDDDEILFKYVDYQYSIPQTLENQVNAIEEEDNEENIQESLYDYLSKNLEDFYLYEDAIKSYVSTIDTTNFDLKGITYHKETNTYDIDDNFIGYARTYYEYSKNNKNIMYFSTNDTLKIEEIFKFYLNEYYCDKNAKNYYSILNYIHSTTGILSLVEGTGSILGLTYSNQTITINDNILEYASDFYTENSIITYLGDNIDEIQAIFASSLQNINLDEEKITKITQREDIMNDIISSNTEIKNQYFYVDTVEEDLLIDIEHNDGYNKTIISKISVNTDETSGEITVDLNYSDENNPSLKIQEISDFLSKEFDATASGNVIDDENGHILTFKLIKNNKETDDSAQDSLDDNDNTNNEDEQTPPIGDNGDNNGDASNQSNPQPDTNNNTSDSNINELNDSIINSNIDILP